MRWFLTFLAVLLPFAAQGAWIDSTGKPIPDTESMRSTGDFGVQILLTADEGQFRQAWNSSRTPPKLRTINTLRLGGSVSSTSHFSWLFPKYGGRLRCSF